MGLGSEKGGTAREHATAQVQGQTANAVFSNLTINVTTNGNSATSTVKFRVGGANGNQVVSITTLTTGLLTDGSNTDTTSNSTDEINTQFITGVGGGPIIWFQQSVKTVAASGFQPAWCNPGAAVISVGVF